MLRCRSNAHTQIYIYIYIHTYIHTYTHTHFLEKHMQYVQALTTQNPRAPLACRAFRRVSSLMLQRSDITRMSTYCTWQNSCHCTTKRMVQKPYDNGINKLSSGLGFRHHPLFFSVWFDQDMDMNGRNKYK